MEEKLADKVALVTGVSYGVGAATALAFGRAGYDVVGTVTADPQKFLEIADKLHGLGVRFLPLLLELRMEENIEEVVSIALRAFRRIDVLVNNAGVNLRRNAVDVSREEWHTVMDVNVGGTFFLTQRVARHWIEQKLPGCVVNIASAHGLVGAAERSTYGVSKAAIIHMTKMLAIEWAEHGIRVNAVAPGRMQTASPSRAAKGNDAAYMAAMLGRIPLHRLATAEEVAAAACWLASDAAGSVTGQTLVMDGGLTAA
ncbi:MAG TPA: SDR family oxidoreductase [Xanthobacteraceae bacterium]|jgi:NAD(P)-dependent dehydrogenase (short-subunit alcohol dehydrogenase family)